MESMGSTAEAPGRATGDAYAWARSLGVAAVVGVLAAVVVVYAYYNDPWRPLAHTLGLWVALTAAVTFGRPVPRAVAAAITFLAVAVVSFYVGLKVGHDIRWAGSGSVMGINWGDAQLWLILAVPAGAVLGLLGASATRRDWYGPAATAALLGLLLGDAWRRLASYGPDIAVTVDLLATVVILAVATRANRRPELTAAMTVVAALAGFVVVSAPDFLEQVLIEGL